MTYFGFHGNHVRCVFKVAQIFFLRKPLTKDAAQIALFLVFNKAKHAKIDLYTYLRLTINGNYWFSLSAKSEKSPGKSSLFLFGEDLFLFHQQVD